MKKSSHILGYAMMALFISGCEGCGAGDIPTCNCEIETTIEKEAIVSPSSPTGSISNYEHDGDFKADAACHAEMFIYFEWEDSARAGTTEVPPIEPSFETPTGYFPTPELKVIQDLISTSENGDVLHYKFYYNISEAQNKNVPEGTSYKIAWTYDASYSPSGAVHVGAYIKSKVYDSNEYARTDLTKCAN